MRKAFLFLPLVALIACGDKDDDTFTGDADCNDEAADVYPGADELCDGVDNDCDGAIDEGTGFGTEYYLDGDGDGFGGATHTVTACAAPEGYFEAPDDCDDLDPNAYPGGTEVCDDADNDCDGLIDSEDDDVDGSTGQTYYADSDADGYGDDASTTQACGTPDGYSAEPGDCDDTNADLNPETLWYGDQDGDGWGDVVYTTQSCEQPAGYAAESGDCNDADSAVSPSADEYCDDIDNNCDGTVDENTSLDALTWYQDADSDEYGDSAISMVECYQPDGYVLVGGDCDDSTDQANPSVYELCDSIDNDCDGTVDFSITVPTTYGTIADAVDAATTGDTICIEAGTYTEGAIYPDGKDLSFVGAGEGSTILDAAYGDRHLYVVDGETVELRGMTLTGGYEYTGSYYGYASGASVYADSSDVTLRQVTIEDSHAEGSWVYGSYYYEYARGGIIYNGYGSLTLDDVDLDGNSVYTYYLYGGLILNYYPEAVSITDLTMQNSEINARYYSSGSALLTNYFADSTVTVDGMVMADNVIATYGSASYPGMRNYYSDMVANNVEVYGNTVSTETSSCYSMLYHYYSDTTYNNVAVYGNDFQTDSYVYGVGGMYFYQGENSVTNGIFAGNTLTSTYSYSYLYGLAFYASSTDLTLTNVDITGNVADSTLYYMYGLIYNPSTDLTLVNTNIVNNESAASNNYALIYGSSGSLEASYTNLYGNFSGSYVTYVGSVSDDLSGSTGYQSVDPAYTDEANWDLTLSSSSPLVDAGDPNILDADGTTSDIGAYGGPGGASW